MKLSAFLIVLTSLIALPVAAAGGCSGSHDRQAMSCADGLKWDPETQDCVATTS